jgi:hypothetical protein
MKWSEGWIVSVICVLLQTIILDKKNIKFYEAIILLKKISIVLIYTVPTTVMSVYKYQYALIPQLQYPQLLSINPLIIIIFIIFFFSFIFIILIILIYNKIKIL